ncbi:uncharacterized protein TNCV_4479811 [Trichonephila clavipes]|nr:uncharacterized protein TNCV_4479811 [Trichonephila clavipes]
MSACGREFHIAYMRLKSSSFEAAGRGSQARRRPFNKQANEKVVCVGLNRSLEQSLQHVGVHYPAPRML